MITRARRQRGLRISSLAIAGGLSLIGIAQGGDPDHRAIIRYQESVLDPQADAGRKPVPPEQPHDHHQMQAQVSAEAEAAALPDATGGQWELGTPFDATFNAIHQIPSASGGKILLIAGSGSSEVNFEAGSFRSFIWVPSTGAQREVPTPEDVFCSGHVLLPDGRALVAGGTTSYGPPFLGADTMYAFNFATELYERLTDMEVARWYPSTITGADGRTLIVSGLDITGRITRVVEVFDYRNNSLTRLAGLRKFPLYPQIYLAADGRYFFTGTPSDGNDPAGFWRPFNGNTFQRVSGLAVPAQRDASSSCFVGDVRNQNLMVMGGGWPATASTSVIKLNAAAPAYRNGPPLLAAKAYVNCLNLPDGTLFEAHGGSGNSISGASTEAALLTNVNGPWNAANPLPTGHHRLYHSMMFLLDDGTVVSMTSNPNGGTRSTSVLLYSPPYLFKGTRPVITSAPAQMKRGTSIAVGATATGATVSRMTLTAAATPTHTNNPNQRYVTVPIKAGKIKIPASGNILPPGWYRLWAVDSLGRVSVARWVQIVA